MYKIKTFLKSFHEESVNANEVTNSSWFHHISRSVTITQNLMAHKGYLTSNHRTSVFTDRGRMERQIQRQTERHGGS